MKKFIRFIAKSDVAGIKDLTSEWFDTTTTNFIDLLEVRNEMVKIIQANLTFKGMEPELEEADEVIECDKLLSAKKELNSLYGKMMVKISDLLDNDNYYVNCKTEAEATEFIKCMIKAGCVWYKVEDDVVDTNYCIDKKDTCYYVTKIYNPERYVLRRISKNDIYKVYSGERECFTNYTIFNWEDVIHG